MDKMGLAGDKKDNGNWSMVKNIEKRVGKGHGNGHYYESDIYTHSLVVCGLNSLSPLLTWCLKVAIYSLYYLIQAFLKKQHVYLNTTWLIIL